MGEDTLDAASETSHNNLEMGEIDFTGISLSAVHFSVVQYWMGN